MYRIIVMEDNNKTKIDYIENSKIPSNIKFKIKNNLKKYRQELNLTQTELAKIIGITRQTLAVIERGEQIPNIMTCYLLSRAMNIREEYLFYIEERHEVG